VVSIVISLMYFSDGFAARLYAGERFALKNQARPRRELGTLGYSKRSPGVDNRRRLQKFGENLLGQQHYLSSAQTGSRRFGVGDPLPDAAAVDVAQAHHPRVVGVPYSPLRPGVRLARRYEKGLFRPDPTSALLARLLRPVA
jgi:hypothetical protein